MSPSQVLLESAAAKAALTQEHDPVTATRTPDRKFRDAAFARGTMVEHAGASDEGEGVHALLAAAARAAESMEGALNPRPPLHAGPTMVCRPLEGHEEGEERGVHELLTAAARAAGDIRDEGEVRQWGAEEGRAGVAQQQQQQPAGTGVPGVMAPLAALATAPSVLQVGCVWLAVLLFPV